MIEFGQVWAVWASMSQYERVCARIREFRRSIGKYERVSYLRVALAQAGGPTVGVAKLERLLFWVRVHLLVQVHLLEVVLIRHSLIT